MTAGVDVRLIPAADPTDRSRLMDKIVASAAEAVADIGDGASLAVGGFGLRGVPFAVIEYGAVNAGVSAAVLPDRQAAAAGAPL